MKKEKQEQKQSQTLIQNDDIAFTDDISLENAIALIQEEMLNDNIMPSKEKQNIVNLAKKGDRSSIHKAKVLIKDTLSNRNVKVQGLTIEQGTSEIYSTLYGVGPIQKYYEDNSVDEIRVNRPDNIYIVRNKGTTFKAKEFFKNEEEIENVIKRMIMEDVGVSIDQSTPKVETVRLDGTRLSATCPPVSPFWNFILRKHDSFIPNMENYIDSGTLDEGAWNMLSLLVRGRASVLYSGNVGSGKTTLMQRLIGELHENLRILVIGTDLETRISTKYPNRDVIELQEQKHLGIKMNDLFYLGLRESPDVIVIEEFRGAGEAIEAVRACTRGLKGSMATAHFNNSQEAVEGTGLFMLEEGLNLPIELAKLRVARAFNIVVQLMNDSITGRKKLISITEVGVNEDNDVYFNELLKWKPKTEDYFGIGTWEKVNKPSKKLIEQMLISVDLKEIERIGWADYEEYS